MYLLVTVVCYCPACPPFLGFKKFEILTADRLQRANKRHRAKFYRIDQTVAEIWQFDGFKMATVYHLGFADCYVRNYACMGLLTKSIWWSLNASDAV